jgi:hypothetical protein
LRGKLIFGYIVARGPQTAETVTTTPPSRKNSKQRMGFYHRYRYSGGGGSAGPRVGEKRALRDYDVTASDLRSVRQSRNGWNGCVLYNCDDLQSIQDQKRARVEANVAFEKQKKADKAKVRLFSPELLQTVARCPLSPILVRRRLKTTFSRSTAAQ